MTNHLHSRSQGIRRRLRQRRCPCVRPAWTGRLSDCFPTTSLTPRDLLRMVAGIIGERYSLAGIVEYNKGGPPVARQPFRPGGPGAALRRDDSRHGGMRVPARRAVCTTRWRWKLLGVASTVLTTRPFVSQARAMARLRGDADYGLAVIDHPDSHPDAGGADGAGRRRRATGDAAPW